MLNSDKLFRRFDEELNFNDFIRSYKPSKPTLIPSDAQLEPIFKQLGKDSETKRCLDCNACGYRTCRDMATAIFRGLNSPDNCIVHAKELLEQGAGGNPAKLKGIAENCRQISEQLGEKAAAISEGLETIDASAAATGERAGMVNDLLRNVVAFCNGNPSMDEESVTQLVGILETTISALGAFDENVTETNKSSEQIGKAIGDMKDMLGSLNNTLAEMKAK